MNIFTLSITTATILIAGLVFLFQLNLLAELGSINRRLGRDPKNHKVSLNHEKLLTLVGKSTKLPPNCAAVFVSFSCSSCYNVLKRISSRDINDQVTVFLADYSRDEDALSAQKLFPEFKFKTFGGKKYIYDLEIPVIPIYLKIGSAGMIEEAADLADINVLQNKIP